MKKILIVALSAALAVACGKKKEEPVTTPTTGSDVGSAGSAVVAPTPDAAAAGSAATPDQGSAAGSGSGSATADAVDIPTETDFEAAADKDITEKNIEAQLSAIEKDLGK